MGYIYKITNEINQKVYIGKTLTSLEKDGKDIFMTLIVLIGQIVNSIMQ